MKILENVMNILGVILIQRVSKVVYLFILLVAFSYPVKASTLELTIEFFKNDTAFIKEWHFTLENFATFLPLQGIGDYQVKILDRNFTLLFSEKFNVLFILQINRYNETSQSIEIVTEELNSTIVSMRLYLPPKSFYVKFYKKEKEILSLNLSEIVCNNNKICEEERGESEYLCPNECIVLSQRAICGNRICENGENQENCCKDCGCLRGYKCIENKCVKTAPNALYLIIIVIIVVLAIVIILKSKKAYESSV